MAQPLDCLLDGVRRISRRATEFQLTNSKLASRDYFCFKLTLAE